MQTGCSEFENRLKHTGQAVLFGERLQVFQSMGWLAKGIQPLLETPARSLNDCFWRPLVASLGLADLLVSLQRIALHGLHHLFRTSGSDSCEKPRGRTQ